MSQTTTATWQSGPTLRERLRVWLANLPSTHHRWMSSYLRRRGWVCFYLEERSRDCHADCWLKLYRESEKRDATS